MAPLANMPLSLPQGTLVWLTVWAVTFLLTGIICGILIGLHHHAKLRGAVGGVAIGLVVSVLSVPIWAITVANPGHALTITFVGCMALLVLATTFGQMDRNDPSMSSQRMDELVRRSKEKAVVLACEWCRVVALAAGRDREPRFKRLKKKAAEQLSLFGRSPKPLA